MVDQRKFLEDIQTKPDDELIDLSWDIERKNNKNIN